MDELAGAKAVRRHAAQHDLFNRLHSIAADERFVQAVARDWLGGRFPLLANQRCGTWYCDPAAPGASTRYAYFKSTDGHTRNWDFNLRRSNLGLAQYAEDVGGIILVDSTRRGKRMPDALSKTVPIWCAVINLALGLGGTGGGDDGGESSAALADIFLPALVSPSERAQIRARLAGWAAALRASALPLPALRKPLRPFFLHPSTSQAPHMDAGACTPIVCLSASRWVEDTIPASTRVGKGGDARTVGFDYVPGAGDDDELWGRAWAIIDQQGLTPALFHAHKRSLLAAPRDDLPAVVDAVIAASTDAVATSSASPDVPTSVAARLALALGPPAMPRPAATPGRVLTVVESNRKTDFIDGDTLYLPSARTHPYEYAYALRAIVAHVGGLEGRLTLRPAGDVGAKELIPLTVALLCAVPPLDADDNDYDQPDAEGGNGGGPAGVLQSKATISVQLQRLVALWPDGNPPRAALKRVNEFLMSPPKP